MIFKALRVFIDVVESESFTEAARNHKLTQSAVSQIISKLEGRIGAPLLVRATRPVRPTELGQAYYAGCKELLAKFDELEVSLRRAKAQRIEHVRVAAIYSVGLGNMGHYVERFRHLEPQAEVHVDYVHPDRVYERVLAGTTDFGLVSFPQGSRELAALPWREEEMVLACTPAHPLARYRSIRPELLAGEKYIGFDKDLVIRKEVDRFLRDQGVGVEVVMEFDNIETIKKAIDEAAGVALLPEPTLRREVQAGTLLAVPLAGCRFVRPLGVIQRRHHKLSSVARRFLDLLRQPEESLSTHATAFAASSK
jgi:DNA-binding transcriptional LysR family regulator